MAFYVNCHSITPTLEAVKANLKDSICKLYSYNWGIVTK